MPPTHLTLAGSSGGASSTWSNAISVLSSAPATPPDSACEVPEDARVHRPDTPESMTTNSDRSEGGVPLMMTMSRAEALNAEMDDIDREIMGDVNLNELLNDDPGPAMDDNLEVDMSLSAEDVSETAMGDGITAAVAPDTPVTLTTLAAQFQSIQTAGVHMPGVNQNNNFFFDDCLSVHPSSTSYYYLIVQKHVMDSQVLGLEVGDDLEILLEAGDLSLFEINSAFAEALQLIVETGHRDAADFADELVQADGLTREQLNVGLFGFLQNWLEARRRLVTPQHPPWRYGPYFPDLEKICIQRDNPPEHPVQREDLNGDRTDVQGIDWWAIGVSREMAKERRTKTVQNYRSIEADLPWNLHTPRHVDEEFFRFNQMNFTQAPRLFHFQLRNLLAAVSRDQVFYTGDRQIRRYRSDANQYADSAVLMDLHHTDLHLFQPSGIHVTCLAADHDVIVAGGSRGEYAFQHLHSRAGTRHVEGLVSTVNVNNITNHAQVHLSRHSGKPLITFSSNDTVVRTMDVETRRVMSSHKYGFAINCTAVSPDHRLRVMVGDDLDVLITNAETGEPLQALSGHVDHGFACTWSDDGYTVATGFQDMQTKIWDARKWSNSSGQSTPVTTLLSERGGVRNLKFSPNGGGKSVLVAAEATDIVNVYDTGAWEQKQKIDFFGDVGGIEFTDGGRGLLVAICDPHRGGMMEFERWGVGTHAVEMPHF